MAWKHLMLVGLGGFIGSAARYALGAFVLARTPDWRFPLGTFVVNVLGCLTIGVLAGLAEKRGMFPLEARLFLFTGICGGFTTFSAFANEGLFLLRRGEAGVALAYAGLSVVCGLAAVWLGFRLSGDGG